MGLIGQSKPEMERERPTSIKGEWVISKNTTGSVTKGERYQVLGHFCYLNRYSFDNDHWYEWNEFITLKNKYDWSVKMRRYSFTLEKDIIKQKQEKELYESDALNILQEAHELTAQRYIS